MEFKDREFIPVLLGGDINTYSVARAFYEQYQVKTYIFGKFATGPSYGSKIIERRKLFVEQLNEIIYEIHKKLSGGREEIRIQYEPDVELDEFESKLRNSQDRDMRAKMTSVGPHRDDFSFLVGDVDIRKFGSQGQQRTAALSLKLSEIELVKRITKDTPVLLLDDVLSELDSNRQNYLLNSIGDIQTIITCTGLEENVRNR